MFNFNSMPSSSTSSSSSSTSTAPTRGAANYGGALELSTPPLKESPDARLGRYDPMAHQALQTSGMLCWWGISGDSTHLCHCCPEWLSVGGSKGHHLCHHQWCCEGSQQRANKALAERVSTACKEAVAGCDLALELVRDELMGIIEKLFHLVPPAQEREPPHWQQQQQQLCGAHPTSATKFLHLAKRWGKESICIQGLHLLLSHLHQEKGDTTLWVGTITTIHKRHYLLQRLVGIFQDMVGWIFQRG